MTQQRMLVALLVAQQAALVAICQHQHSTAMDLLLQSALYWRESHSAKNQQDLAKLEQHQTTVAVIHLTWHSASYLDLDR